MKLSIKQLRSIIHEETSHLIKDDALFKSSDHPGMLDQFEIPGDSNDQAHRSRRSYMAKPQLYSIINRSQEIYDMVDEGEEIDDWMESHISQASQMIDSVFRKLEYRNRDHNLSTGLDIHHAPEDLESLSPEEAFGLGHDAGKLDP